MHKDKLFSSNSRISKKNWNRIDWSSVDEPTPEQLEDIPEVTDWTGAERGKFRGEKK